MQETKETLRKRKKQLQPGRLEYLTQLLVEFQTTNSIDAKAQVLANLANFAFNALNFEFLRQLKITEIFLDTLSSQEEILVKFSIGGLCNFSLDPISKEYIIQNGLKKIKNLLGHSDESILLSTITTLMFLITPQSKQEITSPEVIKAVFKLSKDSNPRLRNLATIFLEDHCTEKQIQRISMEEESEVPMLTSQT